MNGTSNHILVINVLTKKTCIHGTEKEREKKTHMATSQGGTIVEKVLVLIGGWGNDGGVNAAEMEVGPGRRSGRMMGRFAILSLPPIIIYVVFGVAVATVLEDIVLLDFAFLLHDMIG